MRFGDGSTIKIEGKGSITFRGKNGEERTLRDVYYIPTLCNNIISIGQPSEGGNKVIITGDLLRVYDERENLLMRVKRSSNRLYKLIIEPSAPACIFLRSEDTSWIWHLRLGHVNYQAMTLMSRKKMVKGLPKIDQPKGICNGCLMAKQVRKSFPSQSKFSTKHALELVHGDLCGPIMSSTTAGN